MAERGICYLGIGFLSIFKSLFSCRRFHIGLETVIYFKIQVSYLAADSLFPDWQIWTQFLDECTEGLRLDGLAESHPIEVIAKDRPFFSLCI